MSEVWKVKSEEWKLRTVTAYIELTDGGIVPRTPKPWRRSEKPATFYVAWPVLRGEKWRVKSENLWLPILSWPVEASASHSEALA